MKVLAVLLALSLPLQATLAAAFPLPSSAEQERLAAFCTGSPAPLPYSEGHDRLLLLQPDGSPSPLQQAVPAPLRAESIASVGVVVCLDGGAVELETCTFGIFFQLPRVRRDYRITVRSVEQPAAPPLHATVPGTAPPSCDAAGPIDQDTSVIAGDSPAVETILTALEQLGLHGGDDDGDGFSNLREFVLDSAADNADSPAPLASISLNGAKDLVLMEGADLQVSVDFNPGKYAGTPSRYYLYADSRQGLFAYIPPRRFEAVEEKTVSVSAPARRLNGLDLGTLPALGVGEYELVFEVEMEGGASVMTQARLSVTPARWQFTEVSDYAGFDYSHGYAELAGDSNRDQRNFSGGVAAGDFDNDGWVDLYVTRGTIGPNLLFRNLGNGRFEEVGEAAGVNLSGQEHSGAIFADYDGDGWLDLLVVGINGTQPTLFRNRGDGGFADVTSAAGFTDMWLSMGASFADIDRDGDLDLWINHWIWRFWGKYLWRNNGDGSFTDISAEAGIPDGSMADFTTNFTDIDSDGWPDILLSGDYGSSQILRNRGDGSFQVLTDAVISDENGMGGAVGDYDNDGDLDWFVSSIYDFAGPRSELYQVPWGSSGNRLYQNQGDGSFKDVTAASNTRIGYWGWGSCFADFNNDGHLDLFHVNGLHARGWYLLGQYDRDPSRLFIADGNGAFEERAWNLGILDDRQGRGIVCFDYDRDGDVDIFVANNEQPPLLYRNDGGNLNNYLHVSIGGEARNSQAIGARIQVIANGMEQMRELRAGSNYQSQNPVEAYFGLGRAEQVEELRIHWPSGRETVLRDLAPNRRIHVPAP